MLNLALQTVAVVVTALAWVPQVVTSLRSEDRRGLSIVSWALGSGVAGVYVIYGITASIWSLVLSEGAFCAGALWVVATVRGWKSVGAGSLMGAALATPLALFVPATGVGIIGVVGAVAMRLFQARRTLVSGTVAGMSRGSWILLTINVTAWGAYGWRTQHWPLVATAVLTLVASVIVLAVNRAVRRRTVAP